mmetsp:Transcript_125450/g.187344  ORF Transcript_125450/g.187344 Transcript_125450/m.187344 type:complete len:82 (-) Transcript_125450:13-258(-)
MCFGFIFFDCASGSRKTCTIDFSPTTYLSSVSINSFTASILSVGSRSCSFNFPVRFFGAVVEALLPITLEKVALWSVKCYC